MMALSIDYAELDNVFDRENKEGSFLFLSLPKSQALSHWLFLNWTFFIAALREMKEWK